jgi:chromosomal replication initiation ATPase DnaA
VIDESDDASEETLSSDVQKLKEKQDVLDKEISQLIAEGYRVIELEQQSPSSMSTMTSRMSHRCCWGSWL